MLDVEIPRIKSLLANAQRMLPDPIVPKWPLELQQIVDAEVLNMPKSVATPALPPKPFRNLRVVFHVMGLGIQDNQFSDGHCLPLSIRRKAKVAGLRPVPRALYVLWRCCVCDQRRLLDKCATECRVELEIRRRQGGEVAALGHRHGPSGYWPAFLDFRYLHVCGHLSRHRLARISCIRR